MSSQLLSASHSGSPLSGTSFTVEPRTAVASRRIAELLRSWFGVDFAIVDYETAQPTLVPRSLERCNWDVWGPLCREVAGRNRPEIIADEDASYVLAIPVPDQHRGKVVAAGVLCSRNLGNADCGEIARVLNVDFDRAADWLREASVWPWESACRIAERFQESLAATQQVRQLEREVEDLSVNLSNTYEEISLLYRLTQNLKLSSKDEELGRLALEWLADVVAAESLAIQFTAVTDGDGVETDGRTEPTLMTHGACPVTSEQFTRLVDTFAPQGLHHPMLLHGDTLAGAGELANGIRELLVVPLCEGQNVFGYLAAFNHCTEREFGTVEASLFSSVAAILGIHSGNIELYRQQREFLRGVVRALTSAIDAKDPYTCGHSDRVARVAVRLAEELGCDHETLNTIYLSGLLHDIGKIGIDDNVLRKPGKLTDIEYEHIKLHSEIGYRILKDLRQLDEVLPVVLHHHEQWDGRGYPKRLGGLDIPLMARIVAVADAYDAMGSDRPYRQGMPEERLDQVLKEGAGKQWDPQVIAAFFRARDEIRVIFRRDREPQRELPQWM